MKKILLVILLISLTLFSACEVKKDAAKETKTKSAKESTTLDKNKKTDDKKSEDKNLITIKVGAPKAPPVLPVLKMIEDKALGENVNIEVKYWESPEELIAMIQNSENDMYAFPLTVISKLYNKGMPVRLTNVNTWGVSYFLSSDESVKTWADLKGKEIYIPLQSSPPDIMTQYFLKEAGLTKDDYNIVYVPKTELAGLLAAGKAQNATLIEPLVSVVTSKNPEIKVVMSLEEEWQKLRNTENAIPTAGFGGSEEFLSKNHDLVLKFEKEYEKALNWINEHPDRAGEMAEEKIGMKKAIIMKAIPKMGLKYKKAMDAKTELDEFLGLLYDFDPKTVGGSIPDEKMYFNE